MIDMGGIYGGAFLSHLSDFFLFHRKPDLALPQLSVRRVWPPLLLFCAGLCMGLALLVLVPYPKCVLLGYLTQWKILVFNALPAALLALAVYGIIGRAWPSFLASGVVFLGLSLGNYYKIHFRSDPLYFADLFILREASNMAGADHYGLFIDKRILTAVFCLLLGTVLLRMLAPGKSGNRKSRLFLSVGAIVAAMCLSPVYLNAEIYDSVETCSCLNPWNPTENYAAHGFLYPFFHSAADFVEIFPDSGGAERAQALLSAYTDEDIPSDRRVSVIAVMREAYTDFSRYGVEGLDEDAYSLYHQLEAESYTGELVTNIFGGGTIDTERCFLTGSYRLKNFRADTNSYLWYLRDQGYTVEGSHPYYQWFYNRLNVNGYLGFERYRFLEDDYELLTDAALPEDAVLYPEVYANFCDNKASGNPYFSFVVNVQSHGPYSTGGYDGGKEYLTGNYSDVCKNAMNNYMASIMDSDAELIKFVEKLREDPSPVVLVTFGDHLPWMGDNAAFYEEMGIGIDPGTEDGFFTHYSTRYLIWANDAAKKVLGHDLSGEGPRISPCYLMGLVFRQLGWKGPAYMQALDELMEVFPVVTTTGRYVVDGALTDTVPEAREGLYQDFLSLQQYWRDSWQYANVQKKD